MAVSSKGIGGNEVPLDANEAIADIPQNRTLIAQKLTADDPIKPELVEGLTTVEKVFEHFKPHVNIDFEDAQGAMKKETLSFANLGVKGITAQSSFLTGLETEKDQYQKIVKQLKSNKVLKAALEDPEAKAALLSTLQGLIGELEEKK